MTKILFVCHGNICRSPMAEYVLKHMAKLAGIEAQLEIASAATSSEELGNPVYPPARRKLQEHGIDCKGKTARRICREDYEYYDLIIGMDEANLRNMRRSFNGDADGKLNMLLDYAGRAGESVADPWYTGDFEQTWQDVYSACLGLMDLLQPEVKLDFYECSARKELYSVMRRAMLWQDCYGENLDALHDILTAMPYHGKRFCFVLPPRVSACREYAEKLIEEFAQAGLKLRVVDNEYGDEL